MCTPIGIDLGTTFSSISSYKNGRTDIINDQFSERHIPSMVYYDPHTGEKFIGKLAYEKSRKYPQNLLKDSKTLIGRKFNDEMTKKYSQQFQLTQNEFGMVAYKVKINDEIVLKKPEEVSADILQYLKKYASDYLQEVVEEAVITIPAYFSGAQRKATLKAAELAGLRVLKLISEPVAAALYYVTDKQVNTKLLVFDFGGGTLDVSLIEVENQKFQVKAVCGDTLLGGRNIDEDLIQHFYEATRIKDNKNSLRNIQRLEETCINMKEQLSTRNSIIKVVDLNDDDEELNLELNIQKFEDMNEEIFQRALDLVELCLLNGDWNKENVQRVILVGGSSKIPKIRRVLQNYFGADKIMKDLNPHEAVAHGACLQAAIINQVGSLENYQIQEVTPLSLGVACYGEVMQVVIPRNSRIPANGSTLLRTAENNQQVGQIDIFEGERKNCLYNNELGSFTIDNLPQERAGDVSCNVMFSVDEDGILTVSATETSTGHSKSLTVTMGEFRLSEHQINVNILESQRQREEDDLFETFVFQRNELIEECQHFNHNHENTTVRDLCSDFVKYAESLDYQQLDNLIKKYEELQEQITLNI